MRNTFRVFILFVLTLTSWSGCTRNPTEPGPEPVFTDFSNIEEVMAFNNIPGMSIAVIQDFRVDTLMVFGVKNKSTMELVTEQTIFQAASITKSFTAVLVMKLVEEGLLSLDEDVNTYLTSWRVPENEYTATEKVTIRRLLSHTAGVSEDNGNGFPPHASIPSLLDLLNGELPAVNDPVTVLSVPGTEFNYSNIGYGIIQLALTDLLGIPFDRLTDQTILQPLRMDDSFVAVTHPAERSAQIATGYWGDGTLVSGGYYIYPVLGPSGLWTTPADLARFSIEIQRTLLEESDLLISQPSARTMIDPVTQFSVEEGYALGYIIYTINGENYFAHGGHTKGFRSRFIAHESSGDGLVIMINSDQEGDFIDSVIEIIGTEYHWPGFGLSLQVM